MRLSKTTQDLMVIDRDLRKLCGLAALPGWLKKVNGLLDTRLTLMAERDRGFRVTNLRRSRSGPSP